MDTKETHGHSDYGDCGARGHGMCGQGHWGHILIKILVALFIFWAGVQFGELKGMFRAGYTNGGYGYGMMGAYDDRSQNYYGYGPGMMSGWFRGSSSQATSTAK